MFLAQLHEQAVLILAGGCGRPHRAFHTRATLCKQKGSIRRRPWAKHVVLARVRGSCRVMSIVLMLYQYGRHHLTMLMNSLKMQHVLTFAVSNGATPEYRIPCTTRRNVTQATRNKDAHVLPPLSYLGTDASVSWEIGLEGNRRR